MATKKCPNGHQYDSSIYGDNCPFCPENSHTRVNFDDNGTQSTRATDWNVDGETGATVTFQQDFGGGHTVIRRIDENGNPVSDPSENNDYRKIVGILVSYSSNPAGEVYNICEGKNVVGSSSTDTIPITKDKNMSRGHLTILKQPGGTKFWANDNMSSNGTFINGHLIEEKTELHSGDVIVLGSTKLVFLAIPEF